MVPGLCARCLCTGQAAGEQRCCAVQGYMAASHELSAFHNLQLEAGLGEFTGVGPKGDAQPLCSA